MADFSWKRLADMASQTWPVRLAQGLYDAARLPGDVYAGRTTQNDPDYYRRATDLAGMVMGGTYGAAPAGALGMAGARRSTRLPMDELSRMNRAKEQGYNIDAFKGLYPYDWNTVPTTNWRGEVISGADLVPKELTSINSPNAQYAGFFSDSKDVANRFANLFSGGSVLPAKLKFDNPLVIDAGGKPAASFQFESVARQHNSMDNYNKFQNAFKGNYDGVIIKNTSDEGTVYVPKNPNQVRSKFAKFDPRNTSSGSLLAGISGLSFIPTDTGGR